MPSSTYVVLTLFAAATAAGYECTVTFTPSDTFADIESASNAYCDVDVEEFVLCFTAGSFTDGGSGPFDLSCGGVRRSNVIVGAGSNDTFITLSGGLVSGDEGNGDIASWVIANISFEGSAFSVFDSEAQSVVVDGVSVNSMNTPFRVKECLSVSVSNSEFSSSSYGVYVDTCSEVSMDTVRVTDCTRGVYLRECQSATVTNSAVATSSVYGVTFTGGTFNMIGSYITSTGGAGLDSVADVTHLTDCVVEGNNGAVEVVGGEGTLTRSIVCDNNGGGTQVSCSGGASGSLCEAIVDCYNQSEVTGYCPDYAVPLYPALAAYTGVDGVCDDDVNECVTGAHNCDANAVCTNYFNTFGCTCDAGYIGTGVNGECYVDPCSQGSCAASADCTATYNTTYNPTHNATTVATIFTCTCPLATSGDPYDDALGCVDSCTTAEFTAFVPVGTCDLCLSGSADTDNSFTTINSALVATRPGGTLCLGVGSFSADSETSTLARIASKTLRGVTRELSTLVTSSDSSVVYEINSVSFAVSDLTLFIPTAVCVELFIYEDGAGNSFGTLAFSFKRVTFVNAYCSHALSNNPVDIELIDIVSTTTLSGHVDTLPWEFEYYTSLTIDNFRMVDSAFDTGSSLFSLGYFLPNSTTTITNLLVSNVTAVQAVSLGNYGIGATSEAEFHLSNYVRELTKWTAIAVDGVSDWQASINNTLFAYIPLPTNLIFSRGSEVAVGDDVAACGSTASSLVQECNTDAGPNNQLCDIPTFDSCATACSATGACIPPTLYPHIKSNVTEVCGVCVEPCGGSTCGTFATCVNDTACVCLAGYGGDPDTGCTDVDECAEASACGSGGFGCVNTVGSYYCTGDIDECATNTTCTGYTDCANTVGSFYCTGEVNECNSSFACGSGYGCTNTAGSFVCSDINECNSTGSSPCPVGYSCNNTHGSYVCSDIDECATAAGACPAGYQCTNTLGSYNCSDVDECSSGGCDPAANCTNTAGSYTCVCRPGFSGDGYNCSLITAVSGSSSASTTSVADSSSTSTPSPTVTSTTSPAAATATTTTTAAATTPTGSGSGGGAGRAIGDGNNSGSGSLSTGAIVGIAVPLSLVAVAVPVGVGVWYVQRRAGGGAGFDSKSVGGSGSDEETPGVGMSKMTPSANGFDLSSSEA